MPFSERKSLSGRSIRTLGDVICQCNLKEHELFHPGSVMPLNIKIIVASHVKFDEIRIRLKETHSWNSIIASQAGNDNFLTETTVLARERIREWEERVDEADPTRRVVTLDGRWLEIPERAALDKEVGLVRVHHFLDVKLVSRGSFVDNLKFKFPVVLGGDQYDMMPSNHPIHYKNQGTIDKVLARAIANTVMVVTNTATKGRRGWTTEALST